MQSSVELTEDQYFKSLSAMEAFHRLAETLRDQQVTGECWECLDDLGEEIQVWASYSDYIYRHPEEWPVYMDQREEAALAQLVRGRREERWPPFSNN